MRQNLKSLVVVLVLLSSTVFAVSGKNIYVEAGINLMLNGKEFIAKDVYKDVREKIIKKEINSCHKTYFSFGYIVKV